MTAQTANKVTVPVGSDGWNLTAHIKQAFESSKIIIPIGSDAERGTLPSLFPGGVLPNPTRIYRTDKRWDETWDGTQWIPSQISTIWTNASTTITTAGGRPGALTLDTANSQNPSFITSPATGRLQVALAGVYAISWHANSLAGTSGYMSIKNQTETGTYQLINYPASGEQSVNIPNLYLGAGAQVAFVMGPSATVTIGSTIRMTKVA